MCNLAARSDAVLAPRWPITDDMTREAHMPQQDRMTAERPAGPDIDLDAAMQQHELAAGAGGSSTRWLPVVAGGGLALYGLRRGSLGGLALAALGGGVIYYAATGRLPLAGGVPGGDGSVRVEHALTINRPADELYRHWRQLENLPRLMSHLESVRAIDERRSHWVAQAPLGQTVEWDAEIINDEPGRVIAWRSLEGASIANTGAVRFAPAPGGRGTEVRVRIEYAPPAGGLGAAVAKMFGREPSQQVREDLRRFKQQLEAGEVPSTQGQPRGGGGASRLDVVAERARDIVAPLQDALAGEAPPPA
jgi:uncharacterized membrane protein